MAKSKWVQIVSISMLLASCAKESSGSQGLVIDFCSLKSMNIDSTAAIIVKDKQRIRAATNDNCNLDVIHKLSNAPSAGTFEALEVIATNSEGYVSEALADEAVRLPENNPGKFTDYLGSNLRGKLSGLLADGLSMKCNMENLSPDHLKTKLNSQLTTDTQRKTIGKIFQNVNPEKFD